MTGERNLQTQMAAVAVSFSEPQKLLSLLYFNTKEYFLLLDRDLRIQMYNQVTHDQLKKYMGITIGVGSSVFDLTETARRPLLEKIYNEVLEGHSRETEITITSKRGEQVILHNNFRPARNANGDIIAVMVTAYDVTRQRKTEQEVAASAELVNILLDNTDESFVVLDRELCVVLFNSAAASFAEEHGLIKIKKGIYYPDLIGDETQRNEVEMLCKHILDGGSGEHETVYPGKSGGVHYLHSKFKPAKDKEGKVNTVIITTRDITEKKITEQALIESEQRWRFALEGSNLGLWDWNLQTDEVYYSGSYKRLYGFEDYELENHLDAWARQVHPDDRNLIDVAVKEHLENNAPFYEATYRVKNKQGHYRWILARGMLILRDNEGKPLRMIGTHADITSKRIAEEEYKLFFYKNPLPMYTVDLDTMDFRDVNEAALKHYGYARNEFLTMTLHDVNLVQAIPYLGEIRKAMSSTYEFAELKAVHKKKNGELIYVSNTGHIFEEDGKKIALILAQDVTQQVEAEQRLQQSEENYRLLFDNNPLPCLIYGIKDFAIIRANEHAEEFYGFTAEEFKKLHIYDLWPEELKEQQLAELRNVLHQSFHSRVWRHKNIRGESIPVEINSEYILYEDCQARILVVKDITDQVQAEHALKESNERFKLATRATSDAIYDRDLQTNDLYWGEGLHTLFGYNPREVSVEIWESYIHEEDREMVHKSIAAAIESWRRRHWKMEYRFLRHDGTYRYVFDRGFIVRDEAGHAIRLIGAMQDITDQKEKEKQLLESNERFDIVMQATNDLIWDWNLENGNFYRDKEGIRKVYGVYNESSIKNIYYWLQRVHPDDHEQLKETINDILNETGQDLFEAEYRFKRDDGEYVYIYDRGLLIRDKTGRPVRMIGAAQDITERKMLEQQLLNRELNKQKLISQATIETQERERTEIGKELHDNVNQVLTTTKLYLDLTMTNTELKDELIAKSSKNIIYVINEIRQLSRSLMNPSLGDLGLLDAIKDLSESVNLTKKLKIVLEAKTTIEAALTENEKLMIYRIVQEAINNALKHSKATIVTIKLKEQKNDISLKMEDNGIGFDVENIKKGSGLKNIQNRVYLVDGSLNIDSKPGRGCTIWIKIPKTYLTE
jgi:PAS domain S-box-containing protein